MIKLMSIDLAIYHLSRAEKKSSNFKKEKKETPEIKKKIKAKRKEKSYKKQREMHRNQGAKLAV